MAQYVIMKPDRDNVATAVTALPAGTSLQIGDTAVTLTQAIPFGHKFALCSIHRGESIVKYGQVIGAATRDIEPGEHTHVHNVESNRGRGDKVHANS